MIAYTQGFNPGPRITRDVKYGTEYHPGVFDKRPTSFPTHLVATHGIETTTDPT